MYVSSQFFFICSLIFETATPTASWLSDCRAFISSITTHSRDITTQLTEFSALGDHDSCVSLRYSSIITLTTLAEIYNLLAKHPLAAKGRESEFRVKCEDVLRGVVNMTEGLGGDDFNFLDPFLGVSASITYISRKRLIRDPLLDLLVPCDKAV